jgi:hypothetical protein
MPVQVDWLVEDHIMLGQAWDANGVEDVRAYNQAILQHLDMTPAKQVHVILDARRMQSVPSFREQRRNLTFLYHAKFGYMVIVKAANPILIFATTSLSQLSGIHVHYAESPHEALIYLQKKDPTLPDLTNYVWYLPDSSH